MTDKNKMPLSSAAREAELEALLQSAVDAIITIREDGTIESVNPAATRLFLYAEEEFVDRNVNLLMPEPYRSAHDAYLQHYLQTGEKKIIGIGREVVGLRRDGTTFPMHLSVSEFETGGQRYFTGVIHDLTLRKAADAMATRMGRVIEAAVNEVYIFDAQTLQFVSVNNGARRNLGYSRKELSKLTPVDIKPDYDWDTFQKLIAPLRSGALRRLQFETVHRRKDGTDYHVDVNLEYYATEVPPVFVAIILDITERRVAERALQRSQKMESIGQLTGGVAHDFNNLLTVIIGNLELLEMHLEDKNQRDLLSEAQEAADLGARLTERLLAFARRSQLEPQVVDLNELATGLTDLLQRTLGGTIDLSTELGTDLWPVKADPAQIESTIINLAINARDAMPDGGKLILETGNESIDEDYAASVAGLEPGSYVRLAVTDTGQGMTEDTLERVFEPFFTTKEAGRGTGLGLSMIYGFAKQSGGHVAIYSEQGTGTTVNLYLPRHDGKRKSTDDFEAAADLVCTHGELIVVVEDNDRLRELTLTRLKHLGYRVLEASSGAEALDVLKNNPQADLLFSDIVMPGGMSGYDLCMQVRSRYPGIRVLLTSGYAEELMHGDKLAANNVKMLRKPYRQAKLAQAIREALRR